MKKLAECKDRIRREKNWNKEIKARTERIGREQRRMRSGLRKLKSAQDDQVWLMKEKEWMEKEHDKQMEIAGIEATINALWTKQHTHRGVATDEGGEFQLAETSKSPHSLGSPR